VTDATRSAGAGAIVFLLFVVVGSAYIVLAKLEGVSQLYVTFVPVMIMLAYAALVVLARGLRLRDDQSGDNLYYMGFLFTLTSLGVSLYQFTASRAAEEIVQNFGIAIGSTITGIGLRVIFNQMRRDPVEVERTMRLELAEAARRVRRELDASVVEFGYFRRSAQQSAADSFRHLNASFDGALKKLFEQLEEVGARLAKPIELASRQSGIAIGDLSRSVRASLTASAEELAGETTRLSAQVESIATALEDVTGRLNAMQTPDRVIEVRLEPMAQSLAQAVELITAQSQAQAGAVKDALAMANAATEKSIDMVNALRAEFEDNAATNRAALEAAITMIKATADVLNEIKASSQTYSQTLGAMLERTDGAMRTFAEILFQSSADQATRSDRLAEVLPAIEARTQMLATSATRIGEIVEDIESRRAKPQPEQVDG
jgi:hypothetical protein